MCYYYYYYYYYLYLKTTPKAIEPSQLIRMKLAYIRPVEQLHGFVMNLFPSYMCKIMTLNSNLLLFTFDVFGYSYISLYTHTHILTIMQYYYGCMMKITIPILFVDMGKRP